MSDQASAVSESVSMTEPTEPQDTRPENVPEKFWDSEKQQVNHEALLASYTELEKKVSAKETPSEETPEGTPEESPEETPEEESTDTPGKIDMTALAEEYQTNGELSEDTLGRLENLGVSREDASEFIAWKQGQVDSEAQAYSEQVYGAVGGMEAFQAIDAWATENLTEEQIQEINEDISSKDTRRATLALQDLKRRYEDAVGKEGRKVTTNAPASPRSSSGAAPFGSSAEMQEAFSDPRYGKSRAYEEQVQRRVEASIDSTGRYRWQK